jgi:alkylhydroperoxidase family enzyme
MPAEPRLPTRLVNIHTAASIDHWKRLEQQAFQVVVFDHTAKRVIDQQFAAAHQREFEDVLAGEQSRLEGVFVRATDTARNRSLCTTSDRSSSSASMVFIT